MGGRHCPYCRLRVPRCTGEDHQDGLDSRRDTGTVFVSVTTAPGSTLAETEGILKEVEKGLEGIPQIYLYSAVAGYNMMGGGQSSAAVRSSSASRTGVNAKGTKTARMPSSDRYSPGLPTSSMHRFSPLLPP